MGIPDKISFEMIFAGLLSAWIILLFILERTAPLRSRKAPTGRRIFTNIAMTAVSGAAGSLLVRPAAILTVAYCGQRSFGLLQIIDLPPALEIAAGFLLMDLSFYYWHRLNHTVPLMRRFHNVHHLDPDMDVSTSFRFHFVEISYSSIFRIIQVAAIGVSPLIYMIYELCFSLCTVFHHSNVKLPLQIEKPLNYLIVTPRMHGVHHSDIEDETNANYSVIFSLWDRIHKTLKLNVKQSSLNIGAAGYSEDADNQLWNLLAAPFKKQKEYWASRTRTGNEDAGSALGFLTE